jgi:D-alanyl-D-alanine carboxypeptidase
LLCALLVASASSAVRADSLDDFVRAVMQQRHIPGLSIAVVKDGALIRNSSYGVVNVEHGIEARPDTVYKIGSVSKQFIAAGIMLLVQDGKLGLTDPVRGFLPDAPDSWRGITVRHLLTHTSGLARESAGFDPYKRQPDIDVLRSAYMQPLAFKPGDAYLYSNLGYYALAEITTRASGKPWQEFLRERVFVPLGMNATRVTSVEAVVPNRAGGYLWRDNRLTNAENGTTLRS